MKTDQRGFIVPLLLGIIAVLVIIGGVYLYENKKADAGVVPTDQVQTSASQNSSGDSSQQYQSMVSTVAFTFPTQGAVLQAGQTYTVTWTGDNGGTYSKNDILSLQNDALGENDLITIKNGVDSGGHSFSWTVPTTVPSGSGYKLEMSEKYSAPFSITGSNFQYPKIISVSSTISGNTGQINSGETAYIIGTNLPSSGIIQMGDDQISFSGSDGKKITFTAPAVPSGTYPLYIVGSENYSNYSNKINIIVNTLPGSVQTYSDASFGFSFQYINAWKLSTDNTTISLTQPYGDVISIKKVSGSQVTDSDAKFGTITYSYDQNIKAYVETDNYEGENITPHPVAVPAKPLFYIGGNIPVFGSVGRWKTDIVALSPVEFLVVNITGSGATETLDPFVKTMVKNK